MEVRPNKKNIQQANKEKRKKSNSINPNEQELETYIEVDVSRNLG